MIFRKFIVFWQFDLIDICIVGICIFWNYEQKISEDYQKCWKHSQNTAKVFKH